jgi:hypothetical protein
MSTRQKIAAIEASDYRLAWDGCHKIYLLGSVERVADAMATGYDTYPADEIRQIILESCGLVFVSNWGLGDGDWDHEWNIDQCTEDIYDAAEAR